ncbi:MAG TPA: UvrD-helicase domain-containing protein [Polyangiales bacterium]|nr:UvrD-helicase domain-containing protein [Polyangiales bacterium]
MSLKDAAARKAIREALDQTLLVEAAAGTGKTTELVGRIRQVLLSGAGTMGSIAALTFTEKAAGELKLRLRTEIDRALFDASLQPIERERARSALSELETANISTIHGFCTELLRRYPVEAEIDPDFQVAQAEREQTLLAEAFDAWLANVLLDPPEGVRRVLARREQDGRGAAPEQQLLAAAKQLVGTRDFDTPFVRPNFDRTSELEACANELQALAALHVQGGASDPLRRSLLRLDGELLGLQLPSGDEPSDLQASAAQHPSSADGQPMARSPDADVQRKQHGTQARQSRVHAAAARASEATDQQQNSPQAGLGRVHAAAAASAADGPRARHDGADSDARSRVTAEAQAAWDACEAVLRRVQRNRDIWSSNTGRGQLYSSGVPRADVVARRDAVKERLSACIRACDADVAACLSRELRVLVQAYELAKREAGLLDFFDLLLVTRDLLQRSAALRAQLQAAFTHVFVDEFQDTDPVQSEIVLLLCADDAKATDPYLTRPVPGKLFLVGDPKQSIYRFRRADIALYERVKRHLTQSGAQVLQLTTSFRALPEIQALVNAAFAPVMSGDAERGQTSYVPLHAYRPGRTTQPALVGLSVPAPFGFSGRVTKRAINESLPDAVAAWLLWLVRESGWVVHEHDRDVPVAPRHVCLLFRRFRAYGDDVTRAYKEALARRELPHVQSGGRSYHDRTEVIALRSLLNAIEWPDDRLHVYATLRGPWVALHDETLFSFQQRVGHLSPTKPVPEDVRATLSQEELAVAEVLELLGDLHKRRNRVPIAHTLSRFLDHTRAHAGLAISKPHGEQALANVLRLLDLARSYERRSETCSFRSFVGWLEDQADEAQTAEAAVAEETSEGVRIMTVHAAKGLEFPVVILCDPTAPLRPEYASRFIDPEAKLWAQSLCESEPIELWRERDKVREHDAAEVVRLTYVAVTRAQELLVVPVCGDQPIDGWVEVLRDALYPPRERCRTPLTETTYKLPTFGPDSVDSRSGPVPDNNIAPGVHVPVHGEQRVVFWDPGLLALSRSNVHGVAQMHFLQSSGDDAGDRAGQDAYLRFRGDGDRVRLLASAPALRSSSITQHVAGSGDWQHNLQLTVVETHSDPSARFQRARGTRFGSLVHQLFEHVDYAQKEPELDALARGLARELGATPQEHADALHSVRNALQHKFFERVRAAALRGGLYRELPIVLCGADGTLFDGVIDLAFREDDQLCVIDFKTDVELAQLEHYQTQLAMYASAASRALSLPAQIVLLRI